MPAGGAAGERASESGRRPHNSKGDLVYPMNAFDAGITALLPSSTPPQPAAAAPRDEHRRGISGLQSLGNPLL